MRPLHHPSSKDITVEGILHALSDPVRVQIFAEIAISTCAKNCSNFRIIDNRSLPKSTLSHHFRILREAGLIRSERKGVEVHNIVRVEDIQERFSPMVSIILETYKAQAQKGQGRSKKTT